MSKELYLYHENITTITQLQEFVETFKINNQSDPEAIYLNEESFERVKHLFIAPEAALLTYRGIRLLPVNKAAISQIEEKVKNDIKRTMVAGNPGFTELRWQGVPIRFDPSMNESEIRIVGVEPTPENTSMVVEESSTLSVDDIRRAWEMMSDYRPQRRRGTVVPIRNTTA